MECCINPRRYVCTYIVQITQIERGVMSPVSKAQQKATAKYKKNNYDRMETLLPKGSKLKLQEHAKQRGESLNAFVNRAVLEALERDTQEKTQETNP